MSEQTVREVLFIINPKAGRCLGQATKSRLTELFVDGGMHVTTINTNGRGHAREVSKSMGEHYDLVLCAGGDGTLHEVVDGLMQLSSPPRLGYIPAGTFNDVAHSLGLPMRLMDAGRVILRGEVRKLDIGCFQDTFFVYVACFGMFTDVPYMTSQRKKNLIGGLAYFLDAAKQLRRLPFYHVRIEHDGGSIEDECIFFSISNARCLGGGIVQFRDPATLLDDGIFEMLLVRKPSGLLALARIFIQLFYQRHDPQNVYLLRTSGVKVSCDVPIQWTLDGENGGLHREVRIENRRRGIDVIA